MRTRRLAWISPCVLAAGVDVGVRNEWGLVAPDAWVSVPSALGETRFLVEGVGVAQLEPCSAGLVATASRAGNVFFFRDGKISAVDSYYEASKALEAVGVSE